MSGQSVCSYVGLYRACTLCIFNNKDLSEIVESVAYEMEQQLNYTIWLDADTGKYRVRLSGDSHFPVGEGDSTYGALADLETKMMMMEKELWQK